MSDVYPESPLSSSATSGLLPGASAGVVMTSETVPATATPGQAAYEANAAMVVPRPWRWDQLDGKLRAAWEAAAQAAIVAGMAPGFAAHSLAARERDEARAQLDAMTRVLAETSREVATANAERDDYAGRLKAANGEYIKATTERDNLRHQLAEVRRIAYQGGQSPAFVRSELLAYLEANGGQHA